jgi:hypothetical protein
VAEAWQPLSSAPSATNTRQHPHLVVTSSQCAVQAALPATSPQTHAVLGPGSGLVPHTGGNDRRDDVATSSPVEADSQRFSGYREDQGHQTIGASLSSRTMVHGIRASPSRRDSSQPAENTHDNKRHVSSSEVIYEHMKG